MRLLKRLVVGTPIELFARRTLAAATPNNRNRQYDVQTLAVMRRALRRDSNCVDVGCHAGNMLREMLRRAPYGRHLAFEPLRDMFAQLQRDFSLPNVTLRNVALSDASGITLFQHVISNPGYSGIRRRRYDRPNESVQEIQVQMVRLDDVVNWPVHFIKIDVEGAELQVLRGAIETLRAHQPIVVFEHGVGAYDAYGTDPKDVHAIFSDCGMRVSLMRDWLHKGDSLEQREFVDAVVSGKDYYFIAHPPLTHDAQSR